MPATAYCTYTDIQARIGTKQLVELTSDTPNEETTYDTTNLAAIIAQVDRQIIDPKAGQVWTVPFAAGTNCTAIPTAIVGLSADLTVYLLFARRALSVPIPDQWKARYDAAIKLLDDISNQLVQLDGAPTVASTEALMVPPTAAPVIDFFDSNNGASIF
jgi:phage gp36-like protein